MSSKNTQWGAGGTGQGYGYGQGPYGTAGFGPSGFNQGAAGQGPYGAGYGPGYGPQAGYGYGPQPGYGYGPHAGYGPQAGPQAASGRIDALDVLEGVLRDGFSLSNFTRIARASGSNFWVGAAIGAGLVVLMHRPDVRSAVSNVFGKAAEEAKPKP